MVPTLALPYPRITQWDFYRAPQVPLPQGWQNRSLGHFQKGQNLTPTGDPNEPPPLLLSVSLTSDSLPQSGGGLNRPTQQHTSQVRGPWVFTWGGAWGVLGEPGLEKLKQPFRHSFSVFIIFVYTYFFLLLIVHTHAHPAAWRPEDSSRGDCFFPPCGLQESNSQVVTLGSKYLYPQSHLAGLICTILIGR